MIQRSHNRSLQKISRKNDAIRLKCNTRKQAIFNETDIIHTCEKWRAVADHGDLNLKTKKFMDTFLPNVLAIGSTMLSTSDDNTVSLNLMERNDHAISKDCSTYEEKAVSHPFHTISAYREMTQKKQEMRPPISSITFYVRELKQLEKQRAMKSVKTLQREIISQKNILFQLTKALTYCCASEDTRISPQRVECERLLLLATQRYTAMNKKFKQLKIDINNGCRLHAERGIVNISNLSLVFSKNLPTKICNESSVSIMCVLSHENVIKATEGKLLNKDTEVKFEEKFVFENLLNDFNINIQIYTLSLKKKDIGYKKYLQKVFPSRSVESSRTQCITEIVESPILVRQTIFKSPDFHLEGSFNIRLDNLKSSLILDEFPIGFMQLSMNWNVESKVETSGFLAVREEIGQHPVWDRRWCYLEACILKFWNYPSDKEHLTPWRSLDLRKCVSTNVKPLDITICARPRSFILEFTVLPGEDGQMKETSFSEKETVRKYLFSLDTNHEAEQWCMVLNKNIELLRKWKKII